MDARIKRQAERAFAWWDLRSAQIRILTSVLIGVAAFFVLRRAFTWELRALAAWDAASLSELAITWWIILRSDAKETKRRAAAEDPGAAALSVIVLGSSLVALGSATLVARKLHAAQTEDGIVLVIASFMAVICAWALTHSVYTLRYARLFYQDDEDGPGGLVFPGKEPPDDLDFAYFAFTIGIAFATSDVKIEGRKMRRTALGHTMTAFAFNTLILANLVNVLADLFR